MTGTPTVDVNLFVHNGERTVGAAIESVLAQSWPAIALTVIDDGSTDGTPGIVASYAHRHPGIAVRTNRVNMGAVATFQQAFWHGDADFVMPKSGDDLLAPDFIARIMDVLLGHPDCAMCHARGLLFTGIADIKAIYPAQHCLHAVGDDPVARACHVMARYTSSPSFWGIYRRATAARLARIRYRAGWDHALLAELALYGEIRHVPEPLYWRRDGGKPVLHLARAATERGGRGQSVDDPLTEPHWRTPLITTALAHLEVFTVARIADPQRAAAMAAVVDIFRARWLPAMRQEIAGLRNAVPGLLAAAGTTQGPQQGLQLRALADHLHGIGTILPEEDLTDAFRALESERSLSRQTATKAA